MRVIAISHVGSEEDIIEAFVRHTARFCDEMIILDHGSVDATGEILEKLKKEGYPIHLLQDATLGHVENEHANRLLKLAANEFGADWVVGLDADEFIGGAVDASFLPPVVEGKTPCEKLRLRSYYPCGEDDWEFLNPVERIVHRAENEPPVYKVLVPGWLARDEGGRYTGGKHSFLLDGNAVPRSEIPGVWLGHFSLRTPGQYAIKLASRQLQKLRYIERVGSGVEFYDIPYRVLREKGFGAFAENFHELPIAWHLQPRGGLVADPLPYLGLPLRYTSTRRDEEALVHHLLEFSEKLARSGRPEAKGGADAGPGGGKMTLEVSRHPVSKPERVHHFAAGTGWHVIRVPLDADLETTELHFNLVGPPGMIEIRRMKLIPLGAAGAERVLEADEIKSMLRVTRGGLLIWSYPLTVCRLLGSRHGLVFTMGGWDFRHTPPPVELVIELLHDERPLLPLILAPEVLNTLNFERNTLALEIEEQRAEAELARRERDSLRAQASYQVGTLIDFTTKGNALVYQREGWSWPEDWGTWTDGDRAVLLIRFYETPKVPLRLHLTAQAFLHPAHPEMRVDVSVNGTRRESWVFTSGGLSERRIDIAAEDVAGGTCEIVFDIPNAISPATLGLSSDERKLGLGLARMVFSVRGWR